MVKAKDSTEKSWWFMELLSRVFRITGFFLLILGLMFSLVISKGYAQPEDLDPVKLSGTGSGLVVSPSNPYLFDLNNMNPGDFVDRTLVIENNYKALYVISNRAEGSSGRGRERSIRATETAGNS